MKALIPLLVLASACASLAQRDRRGDVTIRSRSSPADSPATFGVQDGRILAGDLDFALDPDGCVRGVVKDQMLVLCPRAPVDAALAATEEGGRVESWSGTGGQVTLEVAKDGKSVRADGYVGSAGRRLPVMVTLPLGDGSAWSELRARPILYVVAAGMSGVTGDGSIEVIEPVRTAEAKPQ